MITKKYHSLKEVQNAILQKQTSCVELANYYLKNIEERKELNAFLEVYTEELLERAALVDKKFESGSYGKLAGMIIGLKDNIAYQSHRVSSSSKILEGFESVYSSTVVEKLLAEDALIIGRCNCDEFAMGASNENSAYGPVKNAADLTKVPGGSSGGSAVAVQADLCLAALGSDTGGSIRQPASFTGTVGLKPTYGRVSRWGLLAYASSFDQIGPITNCVEDSAILYEVISGQDNRDATSSPQEVKSVSFDSSKKYRIAYLKEPLESEGISTEVKNNFMDLLEKMRADGHQLEEVSFPYLDYMVPCYYVLTTAEASSNLSRYSGMLYGHRSKEATDINSTFIKSRTEGFGQEVKRRIMTGTFVLSADYYDAYYTKAQEVRRLIKDESNKILSKFDFILSPTTPTTAFGLGEKSGDPIQMYLADIFTVQAPLAGLPAISIPTGVNKNSMPIGTQITAKAFDEEEMFNFSRQIESYV